MRFNNLKNNIIKILLFSIIFLLIFITNSFADVTIEELEFNAEVTDSGNVKVNETWTVYASEISTLFKTFKNDGSFSEIKNIKVYESEDDIVNPLNRSDEYKYHQDEGYFHALVNPDGDFEIAWGAEMDYDTRKFIISYEVCDTVKRYNDCSDFYWKIVGEDFSAPINYLHGSITIPDGIDDIEDFRVFAHGPLNGTITKTSNNSLEFTAEKIPAKTFVEVRVVTPPDVFSDSVVYYNENKFDSILAEEEVRAEEANKKREQYAMLQKGKNGGGILLSAIIAFFGIKEMSNRSKMKDKYPKIKPEIEYEYFRDIPDKNMSGFDAVRIAGLSAEVSQLFSSVLMSLALKNYIRFEINSKKKKDMFIYINNNENDKELNKHEKRILDYLNGVSNEGYFNLEDFEKYGRRHIAKMDNLLDKLDEITKSNMEKYEIYDKKRLKETESLGNKLGIGIVIGVFAIFAMFGLESYIGLTILAIIGIIWFISLIINMINVGKYSQKGMDEKYKWRGLKKFMEEFSMLDKREIPELVLWEEYLVYATAFGVADEVIKQLKVVYPELNDTTFVNTNYTIINVIGNDTFGKTFSQSLSSSIGSVTNYSSGSGGGGGFSSGGGGGGGRRWRRWSLK